MAALIPAGDWVLVGEERRGEERHLTMEFIFSMIHFLLFI
jgi:hypothetical protein